MYKQNSAVEHMREQFDSLYSRFFKDFPLCSGPNVLPYFRKPSREFPYGVLFLLLNAEILATGGSHTPSHANVVGCESRDTIGSLLEPCHHHYVVLGRVRVVQFEAVVTCYWAGWLLEEREIS